MNEQKETIAFVKSSYSRDILNPFEKECISIIKKALPCDADVRLEFRSQNYISIVCGEYCGDFCRVKASERTCWFSLDVWSIPNGVNDPRFSNVTNKNQRHWKICLENPEKIQTYSDLICSAYIGEVERQKQYIKEEYPDLDENELSELIKKKSSKNVIGYLSLSISQENKAKTDNTSFYRGNSLLALPESYYIVDVETTGLDSRYNDIIEICALKIQNGTIEETFSSLVNPHTHINDFIEKLTGITDEMVQGAPFIEDVLPLFLSFVGEGIIIGHNVRFDVNFLYDACNRYLHKTFCNDYSDTLRIFRKLHPELEHHRLSDMVEYYHIADIPTHRAQADCIATFSCFLELVKEIESRYGSIELFSESFTNNRNKPQHQKIDLRTITTTRTEFDETNPFYKKHCVFTGALDHLSRKDAAQIVVDLGGISDNGITKQTNFLVLGNNDYCKSIKDGKSTKQKKAEEYILKGYDIEILSEQVFYEMLGL